MASTCMKFTPNLQGMPSVAAWFFNEGIYIYTHIFFWRGLKFGGTTFFGGKSFWKGTSFRQWNYLTVDIIFKGGTISFRGKLFEGRENYFCFFLSGGTMIWLWGANNYFRGNTYFKGIFSFKGGKIIFSFFSSLKGEDSFNGGKIIFEVIFFWMRDNYFKGGTIILRVGKLFLRGTIIFRGKNCSRGEMISRVETDFLRGGKDIRRRTWSYFCSTWISCNASSALRSDFLGPVCGAELKITSEPQRNPVASSESTEITKFDTDEIRHQI